MHAVLKACQTARCCHRSSRLCYLQRLFVVYSHTRRLRHRLVVIAHRSHSYQRYVHHQQWYPVYTMKDRPTWNKHVQYTKIMCTTTCALSLLHVCFLYASSCKRGITHTCDDSRKLRLSENCRKFLIVSKNFSPKMHNSGLKISTLEKFKTKIKILSTRNLPCQNILPVN